MLLTMALLRPSLPTDATPQRGAATRACAPLAARVEGVASAWHRRASWLCRIRTFDAPAQSDAYEEELETMTQRVSAQERDEPEPASDGGFVVVLWVLASLTAEVEVLWWVVARTYGA